MTRRSGIERLLLFAREDARDALRERQAYLFGLLFALIAGAMAYNAARVPVELAGRAEFAISSQLLGIFRFLLPLLALGFIAPAIVEKRTDGSLTVLLGLPFSRWTVLLGTLLGRIAVVGGTALLGLVVAIVVSLAMGGPIELLGILRVAVVLLVLLVVFASIAASISASVRTSTRATLVAFFAFFLFVLDGWGFLPNILLYVINGLEFPETTPAWAEFLASLNPMTAFDTVGGGVFPGLFRAAGSGPSTSAAIWEEPAFAFVLLLGWVLGAIAFGYRRFRATDL